MNQPDGMAATLPNSVHLRRRQKVVRVGRKLGEIQYLQLLFCCNCSFHRVLQSKKTLYNTGLWLNTGGQLNLRLV